MKFSKIISICSVGVLLILGIVGCQSDNIGITAENNDIQLNSNVKYNMQFAQSPLEYTNFINKQIEPVTNQLTTFILLMDKVSDDEYPITDAITGAQASLKIIQESKANVEIMLSPAEYRDARSETLRLIGNCESSIEALIIELQKNNIDKNSIKRLRSIMHADVIALTAQFNVYWK